MTDTSSHHGYIASNYDYLRRLRRIEGQARGLQKMVTDEKYCMNPMFAAAAMAFSSVFVVGNSLRLLRFRPRYAGVPPAEEPAPRR